MIMNRHLNLAAAALLIALGGAAKADILTAGPVYAGTAQSGGRVFCWLFNTGTGDVTIPTRQIFNNLKGSVALASDTCGVSLAPGRSCNYFANAGTGTYTCRAITEGVEPMLSGTLQIYTAVSTDQLLVTVPMSK
jgi:hypothetical protein